MKIFADVIVNILSLYHISNNTQRVNDHYELKVHVTLCTVRLNISVIW